MTIPFLDLATPHRELKEELVELFTDILLSGRFVGGPVVENFEREFAAYCNVNYCVAVGSGTDALRFALMASGIERESIVLTVPNTFIATTEAISQAGAIPDFVDINEQTYNMDPEKLRDYLETHCVWDAATLMPVHRLTQRPVSAVIPVHLYGQMADMDPITDLARQYNLKVIEDACQAHGAQYYSSLSRQWETAGSMGVAAAFSFYPGKNLGACGEAGAITTNSEELAHKARMLRDHGQSQKYCHELEGYNGRMDTLQAGILSVKLRYLDDWIARRRQAARWYNEFLEELEEVITPAESALCKSVYHLYILRTARRDELKEYLTAHNVDVGLHYPTPLHKQRAYMGRQFSYSAYPVTEKVCREILSLPMFPGLSRQDISFIAHLIQDFDYDEKTSPLYEPHDLTGSPRSE